MNWLAHIPEKDLTKFAKEAFGISTFFSIRKPVTAEYGPYFAFFGNRLLASQGDYFDYLGSFGPVTRTGISHSSFTDKLGKIAYPEDDFNKLLSPLTSYQKQAYIKWIQSIAKASKGLIDENGHTYMEAFKYALAQHIKERRIAMENETNRIINKTREDVSYFLRAAMNFENDELNVE